MKNVGIVDYKQAPPDGYHCQFCGVRGVKLWRMSASSCIEFHCLLCANKKEKEITSPSKDGRRLVKFEYGAIRETDQIGSLVPAVPVPEGDTCWGYTSVPQEACEWWYGLPYFKEAP